MTEKAISIAREGDIAATLALLVFAIFAGVFMVIGKLFSFLFTNTHIRISLFFINQKLSRKEQFWGGWSELTHLVMKTKRGSNAARKLSKVAHRAAARAIHYELVPQGEACGMMDKLDVRLLTDLEIHQRSLLSPRALQPKWAASVRNEEFQRSSAQSNQRRQSAFTSDLGRTAVRNYRVNRQEQYQPDPEPLFEEPVS